MNETERLKFETESHRLFADHLIEVSRATNKLLGFLLDENDKRLRLLREEEYSKKHGQKD